MTLGIPYTYEYTRMEYPMHTRLDILNTHMGQNIDTPKKEPKCKMIVILDDLTNELDGVSY